MLLAEFSPPVLITFKNSIKRFSKLAAAVIDCLWVFWEMQQIALKKNKIASNAVKDPTSGKGFVLLATMNSP